MKSRIIGRFLSVLLVSVLLAWGMHHYQSNNHQMGREEYLAKQAAKYDKHYERPESFAVDFIACLILAIPFIGVYEGLSWVLSTSFKGVDESSPGPN